ncbi:hypothetical protein [Sphingobacterium paludis]|uniref:Uncharacterized protein n=1 Tax=Sphingobacterium paludis TaxID=1476465 RepID=A0A4R7D613_9SPHI|nr:hypothetical protein [Sphingobacterium paludis]TDS16017.1 hypothetical protein B0I21_102339 [Sphingobacterium paludis]
MKKTDLFGLTVGVFLLFSVSILSYSSQAKVAWGVHELSKSEAAAGVSGTGAAIATTQAVATAIRGASWGARIGAYAGPIGALSGALVGGL